MLSLLTVITARGGSKGIPKKNMALIGGKPLLSYTLKSVLAAHLEGRIVVSTDDNEIEKFSRTHNVEVIKRPTEISGDKASSESALLHAIDVVAGSGFYPEVVLTLQPTSPFRRPETIKKFVEKFSQIKDSFDAMLSVNENRDVFWLPEPDGNFKRLFPNAPRRRQERTPIFLENSALYITKVDVLQKTKSVLGKKTAGFVIEQEEALDINEPIDLLFADFYIKYGSYRKN
ncbi:acylneuraminate cytidylyltransferase family protein [Candidatus Peregrinibacteria bacterium]|nr:acylneuraminate cytidylyltransferase family protein [Candidatus Peregrinibacteria bacterium]